MSKTKTTAGKQPSRVSEEHQNAYNQKDNPSYLYRATDIETILYHSRKEYGHKFLITQPLSDGHTPLGFSQEVLNKSNEILESAIKADKDVLCVYNKGGIHWVVFAVIKAADSSKVTVLYKDSCGEGNPELSARILKILPAAEFVSNNIKEQTSGVDCGIFAIKNLEILAGLINKLDKRNEKQCSDFVEQFKGLKGFCRLEDAQKFRKADFAEFYKTGIMHEMQAEKLKQAKLLKLRENHESELDRIADLLKKVDGLKELEIQAVKGSYTLATGVKNTIFIEISTTPDTDVSAGTYSYQYRISFSKDLHGAIGEVVSKFPSAFRGDYAAGKKVVRISPDDVTEIRKNSKKAVDDRDIAVPAIEETELNERLHPEQSEPTRGGSTVLQTELAAAEEEAAAAEEEAAAAEEEAAAAEEEAAAAEKEAAAAKEKAAAVARKAAAKKAAEETAAKKAAEETAAKKAAEETAAKKAAEETAAKKAAEEATAKKAAEETAAKKAAEEAAAKKTAEEAAAKKTAELANHARKTAGDLAYEAHGWTKEFGWSEKDHDAWKTDKRPDSDRTKLKLFKKAVEHFENAIKLAEQLAVKPDWFETVKEYLKNDTAECLRLEALYEREDAGNAAYEAHGWTKKFGWSEKDQDAWKTDKRPDSDREKLELFKKAVEHYQKAITLAEQLAIKPDWFETVKWYLKNDTAECLRLEALYEKENLDTAKAEIEAGEKAAYEAHGWAWGGWYEGIKDTRSDSDRTKLKFFKKAVGHYEKAIKLVEQMTVKPDWFEQVEGWYEGDKQECLRLEALYKAEASKELGDDAICVARGFLSLPQDKLFVGQDQDPDSIAKLVNFRDAIAHYQKAINLAEQLETPPSWLGDVQRSLRLSINKCINLTDKLVQDDLRSKDLEGAKLLYKKTLDCLESIVPDHPWMGKANNTIEQLDANIKLNNIKPNSYSGIFEAGDADTSDSELVGQDGHTSDTD